MSNTETPNSGIGISHSQRRLQYDQISGVKNAPIEQHELISAADAVLRAYLELPEQRFVKPGSSVKTKVAVDEEEWCCDF